MSDETKPETETGETGTGTKPETAPAANPETGAGAKPEAGTAAGEQKAAAEQQAPQPTQDKKPAEAGKPETRQPPKTSPKAEKIKAEVAKREEILRKLLAESKKPSSAEVRAARKKLKRAQRKLNDELIRIGAKKRPVKGKAAAAEGEKKS